MTAVVTDSAADIQPSLARELAISVVPLSVHFGERVFVDGKDIDAATFYSMLKSEADHPRTAQPPAGLYEETYRKLAQHDSHIVTITLSSALSGTYNSASLAARQVPEAHISIIDSRSASMGTGSLALRAARMARAGASTEDITADVQAMTERVCVLILIDTLVYLQRGGRIGRASSLLGAMLDIKPIVSLRNGAVVPVRRVRSRKKGLRELVDLAASQGAASELYVMHTAAPELAQEVAAMLPPAIGKAAPILPIGPVVGVHTGPGAVGIAFVADKPVSMT